MDQPRICPTCGTPMDERPLTAADGTPLGFAGDNGTGRIVSLVCPNCGHVELHAEQPGDGTAPGAAAAGAAGASSIPPEVQRALEEAFGSQPGTSASDFAGGSTGGGAGGSAGGASALAKRYLTSWGVGATDPAIADRQPGALKTIALFVTAALAIAGMVWLFLAAGPVMQVGGFVALGGPYEIAHPAEDWVWLPTVGASLMVIAIVMNGFLATSLNRNSAVPFMFFWTVLFGSLSIPFFRYGFNGPGGERVWTWIMLGVMFALFALPSLLVLLLPTTWRGFNGRFAIAEVGGVLIGFFGALWVWSVVAG